MVRLRVLYTKHVKRKHKVWQDGEVRQKSTGEARLLSERGEVIGTSKAPKCGFQANAEGLTCFDGYIVNCEEDLDAAAVPEHVVPAKRSALPNAMSQTVQVPNISRRAFRCPKLQLAPSLYSSGPRRKRPSVEDHVPDQDKQSPVPKKQRTDDQILALLQGGPPSQMPPKKPQMEHMQECPMQQENLAASAQDPSAGLMGLAASQPPSAARPCALQHDSQPSDGLLAAEGDGQKFGPTEHEGPQAQPLSADVQSFDVNDRPSAAFNIAQLPTTSTSRPAQTLQSPASSIALPGMVRKDPALQQWQCQTRGMQMATSHGWPSSTTEVGNDPQPHQHPSDLHLDPSVHQTQDESALGMHDIQNVPPQHLAGRLQTAGALNTAESRPFKAPLLRKRHMQTPSISQPDAAKFLWFPLTETLQRTVTVSDGFDSAKQYQMSFAAALREEINLRLAELARAFAATVLRIKDLDAEKAREDQMRAFGVPYYTRCTLQLNRKGRPGQPIKDYLVIQCSKEKSSAYSKDGLWLISTHPTFHVGTRSPWLQNAVVRSCWHGPNQDGRFQIEFLSRKPDVLRHGAQVVAIRGPDAAAELGMLANLATCQQAPPPVLPALLQCPTAAGSEEPQVHLTHEPALAAAKALSASAALNAEQRRCLQHVACWLSSQDQHEVSPVCLIHGPFGCGKSTLLAAMIQLFAESKAIAGTQMRVLLAAHTNRAVDNVLSRLLNLGFTEFLRIGSVKRMDKSLLAYSLHCSESRSSSDALKELQQMLSVCVDAAEQLAIQKEIGELQQGADRRRKKLLKSIPVVGVTCSSARLPVLAEQTFDLVILEESSQLIEPLSLLPIIAANAAFLVAAGDPCQLPPIVVAPATVTQRPQPGLDEPGIVQHGLVRPLFERLVDLGHPVHLLCQQYRCHPDLSRIPNSLFYGSQLQDGCTAEQRSSLIPRLPPLCFLDVQGQEQHHRGTGSISNPQEASVVAAAIRQLVSFNQINPADIGVICFYRKQVEAIESRMARLAPPDEPQGVVFAATVDSFQGMEKPIIVLSAATCQQNNFIADRHRLLACIPDRRQPHTGNNLLTKDLPLAVVEHLSGGPSSSSDLLQGRSKDGANGTATFVFNQPTVFEASSEFGDITGLYMLDDEGEILTVEVSAKFVNGKPDRIEAVHIMRSPGEWDRFMRFMERYSEDKGLGFQKSK
ncbi:hypothetical protein WJX74_010223 [Apatococcus lobatus]|uniref:Photosystem II reaction center Psb28 protein n=1 Tax=Apatococcus lobatus TaxID=904363 RepID=A0AAW1S7N6_9CHLO